MLSSSTRVEIIFSLHMYNIQMYQNVPLAGGFIFLTHYIITTEVTIVHANTIIIFIWMTKNNGNYLWLYRFMKYLLNLSVKVR